MLDITARKQLERELRESDRRYSSTVEQAPVGFGHLGAHGRYLWVNSRLAEMLGYSADEFTAMTADDLTAPDDRAKARSLRAGDDGLPNRLLFSQMLDKRLVAAEAARNRFAVLMLNVDRFKFVNESLGSPATSSAFCCTNRKSIFEPAQCPARKPCYAGGTRNPARSRPDSSFRLPRKQG